MSNERGWKNGVYNPGFEMRRLDLMKQVKRMVANGFTLDSIPEIKGVQLKQSKPKILRNSVTRVVLVGFDPFNHSGLPEHIERRVVYDFYVKLENEFVQAWVDEADEGETRFGFIFGSEAKLTVSDEEHNIVDNNHNPILAIRQKLELDKLRVTRGRDGEVTKIGGPADSAAGLYLSGLRKDLVVGVGLGNGQLFGRRADDHIFHSTLCPEMEVVSAYLFQHAGHLWKHSHSNFHVPGITGVVELYVPGKEGEMEFMVHGKTSKHDAVPEPVGLFAGKLHLDYDGDMPMGRGSYISQFVDIAKETSQNTRNETIAAYVGNLDIADTYPSTHMLPREALSPEELADYDAAMKEVSEGKLDYLLDGTQWDPRNRK